MKEDPPPDAKCRDKFLVQSVAISSQTDTDSANVSQIWTNIEQTAKSSIQERKIRVTFLPADGSTPAAAAAATTNGVSHDDEQPPAYSSPAQSAVTPSRSTEKDTSMADSTVGSTIIGGASSATSALPTSQDDLKQQLSTANAKIKQLQEQMAEGIRQRKPQEAASKAAENVQQSLQTASQQAPGGVPLQVAAGLCLLCFLVAYFFF
jgi:hypothetical protein